MKFHGIDMKGKFHVQRVATLPAFDPSDAGRMLYIENEQEFYYGGSTSWKKPGGLGKVNTSFVGGNVLEVGTIYMIDTTTTSLTGSIQSSAKVGDFVTVVDLSGSFDTNSLVINSPGGETILGESYYVAENENAVYQFVKASATEWKVFGMGGGGGGGSAVGTNGNQVFFENDQIVTASYSITPNKNAMSAGPIVINDGVVVTIPTSSNWIIV